MKKILTILLLFITFTINIIPTMQVSNIPNNIAYAQPVDSDDGTGTGGNESQEVDYDGDNYFDCGRFEFGCKLFNGLHNLVVLAGSFLVGISAYLMDIFLSHSLSSSAYRDSGFIEQGWEILRDATNILFIFALLMIAFKMVLGIGTSNAKSQLMKVIVVALTINFSLFISYAIIDASNIFANVFYNKIEQSHTVFEATIKENQNNGTDNIESKAASLAIAQKINPQLLLSKVAAKTFGEKLILVIMVGVINAALIYVFLSVTFLFLGRTIGLWISSILAPLAFASVTVPQLSNIKYIGFGNWFKSLLETAFMAPVFIFMLYLTVQFMNINAGPVTPSGSNSPFLTSMLAILIPTCVTVVLILTSKKIAFSMAGDFAGTISGIVAKVAGGALAVGAVAATGGAALAGGAMRGVGSKLAKGAAEGSSAAKWGNRLQSAGKLTQAQNFNFGQSRLGQAISKRTGVSLGAELGNLSYARADTAVRSRANKLREGYDNFKTGKTAESVQAWQDAVQESRDNLTQTRIENRQRKASDEATGSVTVGIKPDGTEVKDASVSNLDEALKQRQAALARRTSLEAKAEKDRLDKQKDAIHLEADALQDEINNLSKKSGKSAAEIQTIKDKRAEVKKLKDRIKKVDETSLTGQITQIKKQIDNAKNTARAEMFQDDRDNRRTTQDSGLTRNEEQRKKRVDKQASRVGSGKIKTTPNVGGDPKAEK